MTNKERKTGIEQACKKNGGNRNIQKEKEQQILHETITSRPPKKLPVRGTSLQLQKLVYKKNAAVDF